MAECAIIKEPNWKLTPDIAFEPDGSRLIPDRMSTTESPKYNFAFTVQFFYSNKMEQQGLSDSEAQDPMQNRFAVVKVSRPQPTINYQKVNFYNFRTNVATSVDYGQVTISFYDDATNRAFNILMGYLKAVSPIANVTSNFANSLDVLGQFKEGEQHTASLGSLDMAAGSSEPTRRHGLIKRLRLNHSYKERGISQIITYDYLNPKIVSMAPSDLDMTQNGVATIDMTFNYDSVYMSKESRVI
jgi:hypothetical protein